MINFFAIVACPVRSWLAHLPPLDCQDGSAGGEPAPQVTLISTENGCDELKGTVRHTFGDDLEALDLGLGSVERGSN